MVDYGSNCSVYLFARNTHRRCLTIRCNAGKYPLTAMRAASHHAQAKEDALEDDEAMARHRILLDKAQTARRGETIALVFAMQGVGAVMGSAYILFLLYFSGQLRSVWYVCSIFGCW